jgi:hypothetical protein
MLGADEQQLVSLLTCHSVTLLPPLAELAARYSPLEAAELTVTVG